METDILAVGRLKRFQNYKCGREFVLNEKIYFLKRYGNIRKGPKANWVSYVNFYSFKLSSNTVKLPMAHCH